MRKYEIVASDGDKIIINARNWDDALYKLSVIMHRNIREMRDITEIPPNPVGYAGDS